MLYCITEKIGYYYTTRSDIARGGFGSQLKYIVCENGIQTQITLRVLRV